jgi:hypothetical protein
VPVVKDGELDRDDVSGSSLYTCTAALDFFAKVQRPDGVGARGVQNGCDIVLEHDGGEESNVDISSQLEEVVVLPVNYTR